MSQLRYIIAEPHYLLRKGLKTFFNEFRSAELVCEIENKKDFSRLVKKYKPDIVFVTPTFIQPKQLQQDIKNTPRLSKIKFIAIQKENTPQTNNLFEESININDTKENIRQKLNPIIEHVAKDEKKQNQRLSSREETILKNVAQGKTNKEIANELFISEHTVITHRKNITKKLGIKTVSGLTAYAIINGILNLNQVK